MGVVVRESIKKAFDNDEKVIDIYKEIQTLIFNHEKHLCFDLDQLIELAYHVGVRDGVADAKPNLHQ